MKMILILKEHWIIWQNKKQSRNSGIALDKCVVSD
jgi:hypothetical protein